MNMFLTLKISFCVIVLISSVVGDLPTFRILAPQLVCPKDRHSPIEKPDNTVITIQTNIDAEVYMHWTVRWRPLGAPSQRFTLLLWRTVRALEAKLNSPQPDPLVYVIADDELQYGVNYIFNVTATVNGETSKPKSFYINNTFGEQTLEDVNGLTDMLSVILVGSSVTFADITYVLEAMVTTCVPFYDYHFSWNVRSLELKESLNISTIGSRLEIPPHSMKPGVIYDVTCYIVRDITEEIITQVELAFEVGYRSLEIYLGADKLVVGIYNGFVIESTVINHDYFDLSLTYQWNCTVNGTVCEFFEGVNNNNLIISSGFSTPGQYEITVIVSIFHQSAEAKITIVAMDAILPIIQVRPMPRVLNEGSTLTLVANATNITPMCTLRWYFTTKDPLNTNYINDTCDECQHGKPITDTVTVYSLDENFLYELTDFSNDTEWREVTGEMKSSAGRARFVVECNCSLALGCATKAVAYADIYFLLNKRPIIGDVTVSPSSGTALVTIFRISSRPAADPDGPLRYTFHCSIGNNNSMVLGSYLEHMAVETLLPYVADGTAVWVEVCDVQDACSRSDRKIIHLLKGEGRSLNTLMADVSSYVKRCEVIALQRITVAALSTYTNAGQTEDLTVFTTFLLDSVPTLAQRCISQYHQQYLQLLNELRMFGIDISIFLMA